MLDQDTCFCRMRSKISLAPKAHALLLRVHAPAQVLDQDAMPVLFSLVFGEGVINDATSVSVCVRAVSWAISASTSVRLQVAAGGTAGCGCLHGPPLSTHTCMFKYTHTLLLSAATTHLPHVGGDTGRGGPHVS